MRLDVERASELAVASRETAPHARSSSLVRRVTRVDASLDDFSANSFPEIDTTLHPGFLHNYDVPSLTRNKGIVCYDRLHATFSSSFGRARSAIVTPRCELGESIFEPRPREWRFVIAVCRRVPNF